MRRTPRENVRFGPRIEHSIARWNGYFFYRQECLKTTWRLRLALVAALLLLLWGLTAFWIPGVAQELVCQQQVTPSDAVLAENFDPTYLVFERAAELRRTGMASRVLVPAAVASDQEQPNVVSAGIVELMARVARLPDFEIIPVRLIEPISLNVAYQIRTVLMQEQVRSVIVVTPGFRSRRSLLVYSTVFGEAGITTSCVPVFGSHTPANWTQTWHGVEEVANQYVKLAYYRLFALPRLRDTRR